MTRAGRAGLTAIMATSLLIGAWSALAQSTRPTSMPAGTSAPPATTDDDQMARLASLQRAESQLQAQAAWLQAQIQAEREAAPTVGFVTPETAGSEPTADGSFPDADTTGVATIPATDSPATLPPSAVAAPTMTARPTDDDGGGDD